MFKVMLNLIFSKKINKERVLICWIFFLNILNIKNVNNKNYRYVQYGYHAYLNLLYGQTTTQLPVVQPDGCVDSF
jgi:hypothetical protein